MNVVKLLPVRFLHRQISCLIECLIYLVAVHSNKNVVPVQNLSCYTALHKIQTSSFNYEGDALDA